MHCIVFTIVAQNAQVNIDLDFTKVFANDRANECFFEHGFEPRKALLAGATY